MPECFFDAQGTFTIAQCKLWGLSLTDWRTITGFSFATIITVLLFIFRRAVLPPVKAAWKRVRRNAFISRVRSHQSGKISVLVTRLEGDNPSNSLRESVVEAIARELHSSVETVRWNETIYLPEGHDYASEVSAIQKLQSLLKSTKCDVAVWGRVKSNDAISLRFTVADGASRLPESYKLTDTLELSNDFVQALGIALAVRLSTFESLTGDNAALTSFLQRATARLESVLADPAASFTANVRAALLHSLANALCELGDLLNSPDTTKRGIEALSEALALVKSEGPSNEAHEHILSIQLADTLSSFGGTQADNSYLQQSLDIYKHLLSGLDKSRDLLLLCKIKNSVGSTLSLLSYREQKGGLITLAIREFREAQAMCPKTDLPYLWAHITYNLAVSLKKSGEYGTGKISELREATELLEAVGEIWTRNDNVALWGATQTELCDAFRVIGERNNETKALKTAIAAGRRAVRVVDKTIEPGQWAIRQSNLGIATLALGVISQSRWRLHIALRAFRRAKAVLHPDSSVSDVLMLQINLSHVLTAIGRLSLNAAYLRDAIYEAEQGLNEAQPLSLPSQKAMLLNNLGAAKQEHARQCGYAQGFFEAIRAHSLARFLFGLTGADKFAEHSTVLEMMAFKELAAKINDKPSEKRWSLFFEAADLFEKGAGTSAYTQSLKKLRSLMKKIQRKDGPQLPAMCCFMLALGGRRASELSGNVSGLRDANELLVSAGKTWTREKWPGSWASIQLELGNISGRIGEFSHDEKSFREAVAKYKSVLEVMSYKTFGPSWGSTQISIANAYLGLVPYCGRAAGWLNTMRGISALDRCRSKLSKTRDPLVWALATHNLGTTWSRIGQTSEFSVFYEWAIDCFLQCLTVYSKEDTPGDWAMAMLNLSKAYQGLGKIKKRAALLTDAIAKAEEALTIYDRQTAGFRWAVLHLIIGQARMSLAEVRQDETELDASIASITDAISELTSQHKPDEVEIAKDLLGKAEALRGAI